MKCDTVSGGSGSQMASGCVPRAAHPSVQALATAGRKAPNKPSKGLINNKGENNCFLNVVIQSLWHLDTFRLKFDLWKDHKHTSEEEGGRCVHCALKNIWTFYHHSSTQLIPPHSLRKTLHLLFQDEDRFQIGSLDDAAEALDAVLESLHKLNLGDSDDSSIAHNVFGIKMSSFVSCRKCLKTSEPVTSNRFIEYVYISTLRELAIKRPNLPFETLLKISTQEFRGCPEPDEQVACTDILNPVTRQLMHIPEVLALGLVWPTSNPSPEEIISTLRIVQMQIELQNLFEFHPSIENSRTPYVLRGMICYYGKHYDAYYYCSTRHSWLVFDDATVKAVGSTWADVVNRCRLGHYHPSVLFYERKDMLSASRILSSVPPRNPQPELAKPAEVLPITTGSHPVLQPAPSVQEVPKPIVPESVSQPQAPETEAQTSTPPAVLAGYSLVPHSKKHRVVANIPAGYIVVP